MSQFLASIIQKILSTILTKGGTIPQRIALIMDGNRRYAQKHHIKKIEGHTNGMNTLIEVMKWAITFGVKEVTAFAFSIDNFNRSKEEIDGLINIFKESFKSNITNPNTNMQGIRICIYGNWAFFDEEMQKTFKEIEEKTKDNNVIKLNVCIGYNSTEEMCRAQGMMEKYMDEHKDTEIKNPIAVFESFLYGGYNVKPDLVIRTSGETRLSNFLLYQSRFSMIIFVEKYWPELTFYDFVCILLRYNYNYPSHVKKLKVLEELHSFPILD